MLKPSVVEPVQRSRRGSSPQPQQPSAFTTVPFTTASLQIAPNPSISEPFVQVSRKELQPHLSRFVNEEIQRGHKALAGPARSNSVSLEETEDAAAVEEVAEEEPAEEVLAKEGPAEEGPAEEVLAEEVPASSRATTHGVPGSSEAVTGGGSRGTAGLSVG